MNLLSISNNIKSLRASVGKWFNKISLPEKYILPLFTVQYGCGNNKPDLLNITGSIGHGKHDNSLYYNGILFIRVMLPFFIGIHIRWSGSTTKKSLMQVHIGWKKNGDFAVTFRIQSDATAAAGTYGRNFNHAQGWNCGTH